jgi:predicted transcriptional regulator
MATKASTHRLDPEVQKRLDELSRVLGQPKNRIINEAVASYVQQRSLQVERELEWMLLALKKLRKRDAKFEAAIAEFATAEAEHSNEDPAEGKVVNSSPLRGVHDEIRSVLYAS